MSLSAFATTAGWLPEKETVVPSIGGTALECPILCLCLVPGVTSRALHVDPGRMAQLTSWASFLSSFVSIYLIHKSHGWRSLVDYSPWGLKESDTEQLHIIHEVEQVMANPGWPVLHVRQVVSERGS